MTLEAFIHAYSIQGYSDRSDSSLEIGKEKIAIYTSTSGKPTHASRQLSDGWWASKLGLHVDIEHEYTALDGDKYGKVVIVLSRMKATN